MWLHKKNSIRNHDVSTLHLVSTWQGVIKLCNAEPVDRKQRNIVTMPSIAHCAQVSLSHSPSNVNLGTTISKTFNVIAITSNSMFGVHFTKLWSIIFTFVCRIFDYFITIHQLQRLARSTVSFQNGLQDLLLTFFSPWNIDTYEKKKRELKKNREKMWSNIFCTFATNICKNTPMRFEMSIRLSVHFSPCNNSRTAHNQKQLNYPHTSLSHSWKQQSRKITWLPFNIIQWYNVLT